MILSTKFRTASLDHMRRGSKVVLRKNKGHTSLKNSPGRCSRCRSLPRLLDHARQCKQDGVVSGAYFLTSLLELHARALRLRTACASRSESPLRAPLSTFAASDMGPFSRAYTADFVSLAEKSSLEKKLGSICCHKTPRFA